MDSAPRGQTPAATSCGELDIWVHCPHAFVAAGAVSKLTSMQVETRHGPTKKESGDIVSNLLRFMSEVSPSASPRSPVAVEHRQRVANCATGMLLPFSTGWGALHPSAEVRQRPAALRNSQSDRNAEVGVSKGMTGRRGYYFVKKSNTQAIFPRMSLEVRLPISLLLECGFSL